MTATERVIRDAIGTTVASNYQPCGNESSSERASYHRANATQFGGEISHRDTEARRTVVLISSVPPWLGGYGLSLRLERLRLNLTEL